MGSALVLLLLLFAGLAFFLRWRHLRNRRENAIELLLGRVEKGNAGHLRFEPAKKRHLLPESAWPTDRQWGLALECKRDGWITMATIMDGFSGSITAYTLILMPEGRAWLQRRRERWHSLAQRRASQPTR